MRGCEVAPIGATSLRSRFYSGKQNKQVRTGPEVGLAHHRWSGPPRIGCAVLPGADADVPVGVELGPVAAGVGPLAQRPVDGCGDGRADEP